MYRLNVQVKAYGRQTVPDRGVVISCDPLQNFEGSNHITGTAESKVVIFCTQVGYTDSRNTMTYHQQKGHGYGHVTVLKFCHLLWCSASHCIMTRHSVLHTECLLVTPPQKKTHTHTHKQPSYGHYTSQHVSVVTTVKNRSILVEQSFTAASPCWWQPMHLDWKCYSSPQWCYLHCLQTLSNKNVKKFNNVTLEHNNIKNPIKLVRNTLTLWHCSKTSIHFWTSAVFHV